jgi:hypothetical protein
VTDVLSPGQRRTQAASKALAEKLSTPEAKRRYYSAIGAKGNAERLVLSGDDAAALAAAYGLLSRIAERARAKMALRGEADDVA